MLHILLIILKIAGILLAGMLALILLLLLLVLFVPVRYQIKGSYEEKPDVSARLSWLFSVLWVRLLYNESGFSVLVRIFGIPLRKKEKPEQAVIFAEKTTKALRERKEAESMPQEEEKSKEQGTESGKTVVQEKPSEQESFRKDDKEAAQHAAQASQEEPEIADTQTEKEDISVIEKIAKKISDVIQKIKCTIRKICDKIKETVRKKNELQAFLKDEQTKEAWRLMKVQLLVLWRHIRPRRLRVSCRFGLDDPALTGQVLAAAAVFYPLYKDNIRLYPDFEQKILVADGYIRGRIRIFSLLLIIIRLWKNKQIRSIINKFMK